MIRIVRASTLADLRREAMAGEELAEMAEAYVTSADLDVRAAEERATDCLAKAAFYEGKAREAEQRYDLLYRSTVKEVADLSKTVPEKPHDAECIKGLIALTIVRRDMEQVDKEGTPGEKDAIRPMKAILGNDEQRASAAPQMDTGNSGVQINEGGYGVQVNTFGDAQAEPA